MDAKSNNDVEITVISSDFKDIIEDGAKLNILE